MRDDAEIIDFLAAAEHRAALHQNDQFVPPGQRECPICKKKMIVEKQQGVAVDLCKEHGIWLDVGELPTIISCVRAGERFDRMEAIRSANRLGKLGATTGAAEMVFGLLSLFFR